MQWFDKNIKKPIDLFSHPIWFIIADPEVICPCVDHVSKQANPSCSLCFGTGKKVQLIRVNAAHQNNRISLRGTGIGFSEIDVVNVYYTHAETAIKNGDIIVDGEDIDVVKDVYYEHSGEQRVVYWRIETVPYKKDRERLKKLVAGVLREAGYNG